MDPRTHWRRSPSSDHGRCHAARRPSLPTHAAVVWPGAFNGPLRKDAPCRWQADGPTTPRNFKRCSVASAWRCLSGSRHSIDRVPRAAEQIVGLTTGTYSANQQFFLLQPSLLVAHRELADGRLCSTVRRWLRAGRGRPSPGHRHEASSRKDCPHPARASVIGSVIIREPS